MAKITEAAKNEFSVAVKKMAVDHEISLLAALEMVMQETQVEATEIARHINNNLRKELEAEAIKNRQIKHVQKGSIEMLAKFEE